MSANAARRGACATLSPLVDVDGVGGGLAFAPIVVEIRDTGEFAQAVLVDPFASCRSARFLGEDGERRVAQDLGRAPLRAVGDFQIDGSQALDNGARPQSVGRDVVVNGCAT
jgi:hypothetical protein